MATVFRPPLVANVRPAPLRQQPQLVTIGLQVAPTGVPFGALDAPNPSPAAKRDLTQCYINLLLSTLAPVQASPFQPLDFGNPSRLARPQQFDVPNLLETLLRIGNPHKPHNFPFSARGVSLQGQAADPENLLSTLLAIVTPAGVPFVPPTVDTPTRLVQAFMRQPDGNLLATTLKPIVFSGPPFYQSQWDNPRGAQSAIPGVAVPLNLTIILPPGPIPPIPPSTDQPSGGWEPKRRHRTKAEIRAERIAYGILKEAPEAVQKVALAVVESKAKPGLELAPDEQTDLLRALLADERLTIRNTVALNAALVQVIARQIEQLDEERAIVQMLMEL